MAKVEYKAGGKMWEGRKNVGKNVNVDITWRERERKPFLATLPFFPFLNKNLEVGVLCLAKCQKQGFEIPLLKALSNAVSLPVIASSGAGTSKHFEDVFNGTEVTAALAAGIFHRNEVPLSQVKEFLNECDGFEIRL